MIFSDDLLQVRVLEDADAEPLVQLVQANLDLPWLDWWTDLEGNRSVIRESLRHHAEGQGMWCGIWEADRLAGVVGLNNVNSWNRSARVDYWLGRAFYGRGLVTRAGRGMVRHAFQELQLHRLQITCGTANVRSAAVAERLGFTREGVLRGAERFNPRVHPPECLPPGAAGVDSGTGEWFLDHFIYSLLRPEWEAQGP